MMPLPPSISTPPPPRVPIMVFRSCGHAEGAVSVKGDQLFPVGPPLHHAAIRVRIIVIVDVQMPGGTS